MTTISAFCKIAVAQERVAPPDLSRWPVAPSWKARGVQCVGARGAAVNAIFFACKRSFHGILRVTRRPLASLGLTAARFDLLYELLSREHLMPSRTRQSELRRRLGVCASVVSRMLASLEALGWVTRERLPQGHDRRQRWVTLTPEGRQRITAAFHMLRRASWRLVHEAICFGQHRDRSLRFVHSEHLESYLRAMRTEYGDTATLSYPWHPDD